MLSREALEAALPLAQRLDASGIALRAMDQTPLGELAKNTRSDSKFNLESTAGEFTPDLLNIEYIANARDDVMGLCPHDVCMDNVAEVGIKAVRAHLNIARNLVAPAVAELYEAVTQAVNQLPVSNLLNFEVKIFDLPAPYRLPQLDGMVRRWEGELIDQLPLNIKCPSLSVEEIRELMATGAGGMDEAVSEWLATKGDGFLMQVWEDLFQVRGARFKVLSDALNNPNVGADYALVGFFVSRKLAEDPIEGIEMPLAQFERAIAIFRNQCAAKICRVLGEWEATAKRGQLVKASGDTWIEVYGHVYKAFIEAGGENEVLFGNLLEKPIRGNVESIAAAATELKLAWRRYEQINQVTVRDQRYNATKAILAREFARQIDAVKEDVEGPDVTAGTRAIVMQRFKDEMSRVKAADFESLYRLCLRLVCRARFYQTDAEDFLLKLEALKAQQPNLDMREAALIATIEYVSEWVASMFKFDALA
jgi:hypothetical protein